MTRQYAYFNELPVKTEFTLNGNAYRKMSTRTAKIIGAYGEPTFYFTRREVCVVGLHSRLASDYHATV